MSSVPDERAFRPVAAPPAPALWLAALKVGQLDELVTIEREAYPFPWTRGNFIDSMAAGYEAQVLTDRHRVMLGYMVAMPGVDEMHLLNLTVARQHESRGYARYMLDALVRMARDRGDAQLWLEVRPSNQRARDLYLRYGFSQVGLRKAYYPAEEGRREDALVMSYPVAREGVTR